MVGGKRTIVRSGLFLQVISCTRQKVTKKAPVNSSMDLLHSGNTYNGHA